jgi:hypothetical protein
MFFLGIIFCSQSGDNPLEVPKKWILYHFLEDLAKYGYTPYE